MAGEHVVMSNPNFSKDEFNALVLQLQSQIGSQVSLPSEPVDESQEIEAIQFEKELFIEEVNFFISVKKFTRYLGTV